MFLHSIYNTRFQDSMSSGAGVFCVSVELMAVKVIFLAAWVKTNLARMNNHAN
jgi:hypothetical protein